MEAFLIVVFCLLIAAFVILFVYKHHNTGPNLSLHRDISNRRRKRRESKKEADTYPSFAFLKRDLDESTKGAVN